MTDELVRGNRRFWDVGDVALWIGENVKLDPGDDSWAAAVWWCCYRAAEDMLMNYTIKDMARELRDGIGAYNNDAVTDMVRGWTNEAGDEGDLPGIDDAIEADLCVFFNEPEPDDPNNEEDINYSGGGR